MTNPNNGNAKVALVTGASMGGSGMAVANALAAAGYVTFATTRRPQEIEAVQSGNLRVMALDVTDESSMRQTVETIEREFGAVDVLINNAAYGEMGPIEEVPIHKVRRQFETNVFGLIRMCQLVLPGMRRKGQGRIINVSSMGGEFTTPFAGLYHATKYAVESISDALRMEVQPHGVDVSVIQPGGINTPLARRTIEAVPNANNSAYAGQLGAFNQVNQTVLTMLDQFAVSPDVVARVIVDAIQSERPLTRYKVNTSDTSAVNAERNITDRAKDAQILGQYGLA